MRKRSRRKGHAQTTTPFGGHANTGDIQASQARAHLKAGGKGFDAIILQSLTKTERMEMMREDGGFLLLLLQGLTER